MKVTDEVIPHAAYGVGATKIVGAVGNIEHIEILVRLNECVHEL